MIHSINDILEHLKKDKVNNGNIINFIEGNTVTFFNRVGDSVVIKGISDREWIYISSNNEEELKLIKNTLSKEDKAFAVIEDWMLPVLLENKGLKWILSCDRLYIPENCIIEESTIKTEELILEDAKAIYENSDYKEFLSIEYVEERIKNGLSSCIRIDNEPVAWVMTQDDGAIGFLHVMPMYRRFGYGKAVTLDIINKVRSKSLIPIVHIEEKNKKSMNLAKKMGFVEDKKIHWLEME